MYLGSSVIIYLKRIHIMTAQKPNRLNIGIYTVDLIILGDKKY